MIISLITKLAHNNPATDGTYEIEDIEPKDDNTTNEDKEKNNESSNVNSGIKFKFKILEAIENIFD